MGGAFAANTGLYLPQECAYLGQVGRVHPNLHQARLALRWWRSLQIAFAAAASFSLHKKV